MTAEEAQQALAAACADAKVATDTIIFVPCSQDPADKVNHALLIPPGDKAEPEHRSVLDDVGKRAVGDRSKARILCWTGIDRRIVGPVLRHRRLRRVTERALRRL